MQEKTGSQHRTELIKLMQRMKEFHFTPDAEVLMSLAERFPESRNQLESLAAVKRGYNELIIQALTQTISDKDFLCTLDRLGTQLDEFPRFYSDSVSPMATFASLFKEHDLANVGDVKLWTERPSTDRTIDDRPRRG